LRYVECFKLLGSVPDQKLIWSLAPDPNWIGNPDPDPGRLYTKKIKSEENFMFLVRHVYIFQFLINKIEFFLI
jgi:hypothetical protein